MYYQEPPSLLGLPESEELLLDQSIELLEVVVVSEMADATPRPHRAISGAAAATICVRSSRPPSSLISKRPAALLQLQSSSSAGAKPTTTAQDAALA